MNVWELPTSLEVGGVGFSIRTDYRVIIRLLNALSGDKFEPDEKAELLIEVIYIDFEKIPSDKREEALHKAEEFINMDIPPTSNKHPSVVDWDKDAPLIISAVSRVLGHDLRLEKDMHWWEFLSAYMEIGDGIFASVISIRSKKQKHKKLEKYEIEFYRENKEIIDLQTAEVYTKEEKEALKRLFR